MIYLSIMTQYKIVTDRQYSCSIYWTCIGLLSYVEKNKTSKRYVLYILLYDMVYTTFSKYRHT